MAAVEEPEKRATMARAGEWEEVALRRMGGSRGFREDLSEITRALARHLRGVADFLAPPPPPRFPVPSLSAAAVPSVSSSSPSRAMVGVRSDLAEIGGGFKTGFAALSSLLRNSADKDGVVVGGCGEGRQFVAESSEIPPVVGVTKDVLEFVRFLSARPEEWVQCPVPLDSHFDMSDVRGRHIADVERLVPSLEALRVRLCPNQISEGTFWKIYLFLLHPKLSENDSELLSTMQIVEEMDRALQELRNRIIRRLENSRADAASHATGDKKCEIEEVDEQAPGEVSPALEMASSSVDILGKGSVDQWLEDVEFLTSRDARRQLGSEDDILFSDLENEDNHLGLKRHTSSSSMEVVHISPPSSCSEWVPLRRRSGYPPQSDRSVKRRLQGRKADGDSSDWVDAGDSDSTLG